MSKLTDIISRLFNPGPGGVSSSDRKGAKKNKNSLLINEIEYTFRESIEERSTERHLLFDCAYVAYVPQKYYRDIHLSFGVITQELVERFHEILTDKLKKDKDLKFKPVYGFWSFDIIPLNIGSSDTPDNDNPDSIVSYEDLEENFVAVRSSLIPSDLYDFTATDAKSEVRTNRSQPNSKRDQLSVLNIGAIQGLKPNGRGFQYPIDLEIGGETPSASKLGTKCSIEIADGDVYFSYGKEVGKHRIIEMSVPSFYIGGATASSKYQGNPMVSLSSEAVLSPHVQIRLDADGKYKIKGFAPIRVNGADKPANEWVTLSDKNSYFFINDIELHFNRIS